MAQPNHTPRLLQTEEALTVLFCLIDDAYAHLNPRARCYESIKRLSDSEIIALALFQQLRGVESERSFLRDAQRFFSHLFPGVVGLHPSSFHRRMRKLRRFLEPLRRDVLCEMVGDPETLLVDSTLLSVLHPLLRSLRARASPVRRGYVGVRSASTFCEAAPHLRHQWGPSLLRTHPLQNVADVCLTEELIDEAALGDGVARRLLGDLAYRSEGLKEPLAEIGILLVTEPSERRHGLRQRVEIAISSLKRVFGLSETLATTLVGLATRIAAKIAAYTYAFAVNRMLGRPQGRIKELWA
jgi:hypothetical protein